MRVLLLQRRQAGMQVTERRSEQDNGEQERVNFRYIVLCTQDRGPKRVCGR
jgi:hypothetical protein